MTDGYTVWRVRNNEGGKDRDFSLNGIRMVRSWCVSARGCRVMIVHCNVSAMICIVEEAGMARSPQFPVPDLPPSPHYPLETCFFQKRSFEKSKVVWHSFQPACCKQWPFLHYHEYNDLAYCHTCSISFKHKRMRTLNADPAFVGWLCNCCLLQGK